MSYPLPDSVRALQAKVRKFVDEVAILRELEAEANPEAGREFRAEAKEFAKANGLMAMTLPKELGGGGLSFLNKPWSTSRAAARPTARAGATPRRRASWSRSRARTRWKPGSSR